MGYILMLGKTLKKILCVQWQRWITEKKSKLILKL